MNKQKFVSALRNPRELSGQDLNDIKEVIKSYPYFVSARTLLAKGVKLKYPDKSSKFVASASLYVPDRGFFKKYIENDLFFVGESATTREGVTAKPDSTAKPKGAPTAAGKRPSSAAGKKGPVAAPKKQEPAELDNLITDIFKELEELKASKQRFKEMESRLLEDEEVERALAKAQDNQATEEAPSETDVKSEKEEEAPSVGEVEKEGTDSVTEVDTEDTVSEEPARPEANIEQKTEEVKKDTAEASGMEKIEPAEEKAESKVEDKEEQKTTSRKRKKVAKKEESEEDEDFVVKKFVDPKEGVRRRGRLEEVDDEKVSETPKKEEKKEEPTAKSETTAAKETALKDKDVEKTSVDKTSVDKTSVDKTSTPKSTSTAAKEEKTKDDLSEAPAKEEKEQIVDEFIKKSPNISPAKKSKDAGDKEKKDLSEKSTRFKADVASEYLAEIYIEQGKYDRAISIYENLSLKFPEKKSYFAGLIEKLSKK